MAESPTGGAMNDKRPDLVLRIALLRGDDDPRELSPSIWRRFRCNSLVNLDVFQDKILQPIMGWTRNYHCYYFQKRKNKFYLQDNMCASDAMGMHHAFRAQGERLDPTQFSLGDVLKKQGKSCYYAYDLGDHWYHKITVEKVISENDDGWSGKCVVLDGAMRCPDEDGEGGHRYQEQMLDLYEAKQENPASASVARNLASVCWDRVNAMNVGGIFEPSDFSVCEAQAALEEALRSRCSVRRGSIGISMGAAQLRSNYTAIMPLQPGQRKTCRQRQDLRGEKGPPCPHREPFFLTLVEIVNTKPDEDGLALCNVCGSPYGLKKCSRCHSVHYCGKLCQKEGWKLHKKQCKQDKCNLATYHKQLNGTCKIPDAITPTGRTCLKMYDPENMRFQRGTKVECRVGENLFAKGTVMRVLHECEGIVHAYQVQLDKAEAAALGWKHHMALIWAEWDCDYMIREI